MFCFNKRITTAQWIIANRILIYIIGFFKTIPDYGKVLVFHNSMKSSHEMQYSEKIAGIYIHINVRMKNYYPSKSAIWITKMFRDETFMSVILNGLLY